VLRSSVNLRRNIAQQQRVVYCVGSLTMTPTEDTHGAATFEPMGSHGCRPYSTSARGLFSACCRLWNKTVGAAVSQSWMASSGRKRICGVMSRARCEFLSCAILAQSQRLRMERKAKAVQLVLRHWQTARTLYYQSEANECTLVTQSPCQTICRTNTQASISIVDVIIPIQSRILDFHLNSLPSSLESAAKAVVTPLQQQVKISTNKTLSTLTPFVPCENLGPRPSVSHTIHIANKAH